MKTKGFTLMELTIALSLIVLALTAVTIVYSGSRGSAKRAICLNNLRNLGLSLHLYAEDNDGFFPPDLAALEPYYKNPDVLFCPAVPHARAVSEQFSTDYLYRTGLRNDDPAGEPVIADNQPRHQRGANILTVDGAARWQPISTWRLFAAQVEGRDKP